jgi:high-affinity K+ transport system ATPase subunit B
MIYFVALLIITIIFLSLIILRLKSKETFGITNKDVMVFGDKEMIVNFSCITIPVEKEGKNEKYF